MNRAEPEPATERSVIVTGAAGGIGKALTRALLDDGHCVAAVDKNAEALERICGDNREPPTADRLYPIVADLGSDGACKKAVETAVSRFGRVEAIINNAGIGVSSLRPDAESRHPSIEARPRKRVKFTTARM